MENRDGAIQIYTKLSLTYKKYLINVSTNSYEDV